MTSDYLQAPGQQQPNSAVSVIDDFFGAMPSSMLAVCWPSHGSLATKSDKLRSLLTAGIV